ncbi:MAG: PQQ-binding-like beta-propeller repeat protein [Bacteroidota bacterium]
MKDSLKIIAIAGFIASLFGCADAAAQDTQWRGLNRDGIYLDTSLLRSWPEEGPELILKMEGLGNGYSTPVLYKDNLFITGRRDSLDVITKVNLQGTIQWETVYGKAWNQSFQETRGTPTIEDDRIYLTGGLGTVVCIDSGTGAVLWSRNTHLEFQGEFHRWGMVESLLLTEKAVISSPVGTQTAVVALDKMNGSLLWRSDTVGGVRSYASPVMINHKGRRMILFTSNKELFAVDPEKGTILWEKDLVTGYTGDRNSRINTNTPLYFDGDVFITSGYNAEALMFTIAPDGSDATLKWSSATLDSHHGSVILLDGYLYGANWLNNGNGNWVCQRWETGEVMYEEKWHNKGSIIYADGMLYLFEEKRGHVGLVEPDPGSFRLVSSFRLEGGSGPFWAHMSIYDQKLLIRHGEVLFVYNISAEN